MPDEPCQHSQESTDEGLIACFQSRGCLASLNLLVQRHLASIHQLLASMLLDDSLADDLTQDVFLRAIRGLPRFQRNAAFSTWLYRIAMNVAYSHFESTRGSEVPHLTVDPIASQPLPEQAASANELQAEIDAALLDLSPTLRAAIVLTCLQGQSPEQAAEIENCSVSTMYWRIHEARKQLKSQLQRHFQ